MSAISGDNWLVNDFYLRKIVYWYFSKVYKWNQSTEKDNDTQILDVKFFSNYQIEIVIFTRVTQKEAHVFIHFGRAADPHSRDLLTCL